MSQTGIGDQDCQNTLRKLDVYLDSTLPPEESHALAAHLDGCPACSEELTKRRDIRIRLRAAALGVQPPDYLETRIRAHVQTETPRRPWTFRLAAVVAMVAVCAGAAVFYQRGHLRFNRNTQESYIAAISGRVPALMRVGLGDHVHCSVYRNYPKNPPTVQELSERLDPQYRGLIPILQANAPDGYRLRIAHLCTYHGRRFIHLSLMSGLKQLSLVIAKKGEGESFSTGELAPVLSESGIPIYASGVQRFQMAAFDSGAYLVYVISELSQGKNLELASALAPKVNGFLRKIAS